MDAEQRKKLHAEPGGDQDMRHVHGGWIDVALQTEESLLPARQQHLVDASVRIVARQTPFHFDRRMLEDKRPAFLHVALDAGFPSDFRIVARFDVPCALWQSVHFIKPSGTR